MTEEVNARKQRFGRDEALALLNGIDELVVAKGKKVNRVDLRGDNPGDDALSSMMLGPTGNLRAPTLRVGRKLIVGFNADLFAEELA